MRSLLALASVPALLLAACSDDGGGSCKAPLVDAFDNGFCAAKVRLTGEYVDWDTETAFCGINMATLDAEGDALDTVDTSNPNGRFDLCTPDVETSTITVQQPTAMSQCSSPASGYTTPTIVWAHKSVIQAGAFYSARSWTTARQDTLFTLVGAPFDAAKAQVHVRVDGNPRAVTLAAAHGTALVIATGASTWSAGTTGEEVFFPNVDVGSGQTMLTVAGGAVGTGNIPLIAGTLTNVTVLAP